MGLDLLMRKGPAHRLEWPSEWASSVQSWRVAGTIFLGLLAVFMPTAAAIAFLERDPTSLILLAGSPVMALSAVLVYLSQWPRRHGRHESVVERHIGEVDQRAVVVPYSLALTNCYWLATVAMLLFFGFLTAVQILAGMSGGFQDIGLVAGLIGTAAASAYLACFGFDILRGKLARGAVALAPDGVYHRSWAFQSFFPWESILSVRAVEAGGPLIEAVTFLGRGSWYRRTSKLWKQEELAFDPHMAVHGRWLSVDPALLYWALRYYHEHPEARGELAGTAGVRRLRGGVLS